MILAIDPGTTESAFVLWDGQRAVECGFHNNDEILRVVESSGGCGLRLAIEQVRSYGMAVGKEVFDTVHWCGRFHQKWADTDGGEILLVPRQDVKVHLCHTAKAKDPNIRQALIDRFGIVGTKKNPGPLFGISGHLWAALAVAVYCYDTTPKNEAEQVVETHPAAFIPVVIHRQIFNDIGSC